MNSFIYFILIIPSKNKLIMSVTDSTCSIHYFINRLTPIMVLMLAAVAVFIHPDEYRWLGIGIYIVNNRCSCW